MLFFLSCEFVLKALNSDNFRRLCRDYGISAKTGYKWKERFMAQGFAGLSDESRRPDSSTNQLSEQEACAIVRLKQLHPHWGPLKLQEVYRRAHDSAPSLSSFKRVLERAGMVQKRATRPARAGGRLSSGKRAEAVNDVWSVDFKGWWHDRCCFRT